MTDQALNAAVTRLERALAQAERAAVARDSAGSDLAESLTTLEQRHAVLRAQVQKTIGQLDTLIADTGTDAR